MDQFLPINHQKQQVQGIWTPVCYFCFLFEISNWKEDNIKDVLGYNCFQLPFWAKIIYSWNNHAVEICFSFKNLICQQLLPVQEKMYWGGKIE